jgi:hypothetical protein
MLAVQNLLIYGVPILVSHEVILTFTADELFTAGREVLILNVAMAGSWLLSMRMFQPGLPYSYVFFEINREGIKGWRRMGFSMIVSATTFQVLLGLNLLGGLYAILPNGSDSLINTLVSVVGACGFFLVSMVIGGGAAPVTEKTAFWVLLTINALISASGFLLAGAAAYLISVAAGLFWSGGRVPWRFLAIAFLGLTFLNVGKTTMRERYWGTDESRAADISISQMPAHYAEWADVSLNAILENSESTRDQSALGSPIKNKNQTLLDRLDNLQNLLFVVDAMDFGHVKPLYGKTYSLIPPLLIPRVLWPDKPRSHEGQILLNVHFGRQDLNSTFTTYIAWGLLPEVYGNFGPITGSLLLGVFLGVSFAWMENFLARKLLVSTEGLIALSIFMNLMNSFEMVASVLVTSMFQSIMVIVIASAPFVRRMRNPRPLADSG